MVLRHVDDCLLEMSRWHLAVEENVQLAITPSLELGQAKVCTDEAHCRSTTPDVATLACQIPACRVQHLTGEVDHWNLCDVVCTSADTGRECSQPHGGCLCNDRIGDGTQRTRIHERDEDTEDSLRIICAAVLRDGCADAEKDQERAIHCGAPKKDVTASEASTQRDRQDGGDELEARVDEAELEGEVCLWAA